MSQLDSVQEGRRVGEVAWQMFSVKAERDKFKSPALMSKAGYVYMHFNPGIRGGRQMDPATSWASQSSCNSEIWVQ